MDNTNCSKNIIDKDIQKETLEASLAELKTQIKRLANQNMDLQSKLDEENKTGYEMTKLLRARRPFNQTESGEFLFPGKKEMELKLEIMTNEVSKLRAVLNGFHRDRCQLNLTREILKKIRCSPSSDDNKDKEKIRVYRELIKQYNQMRDDFDKKVLKISKYRVISDNAKKELDENEKRLEETRIEYNYVGAQLAKLESNAKSNENNEINICEKLNEAKDKLNGLHTIVKYQMDELNSKNKLYMDAVRDKEYQIARANNLCKEKEKMTAEFETEFNRVKEYFKKRIQHVEHLPNVLQAVQTQITAQKEKKILIDNSIEILNKKLRSLTVNPCTDSNESRKLTKLKANNIDLKKRLGELENVLPEIQRSYEETKRNTSKQISRLDDIKSETIRKTTEIQSLLKIPTEEYLCTISKIQYEMAKIKGYSCFENGKLNLVSSVLEGQIDTLAGILKHSQEQVNEMKNLQKYLMATWIDSCTFFERKDSF